MADKPSTKRKLRLGSETVRERASTIASAPAKKRRVKQTVRAVGRPIKAARNFGAREYYLPMPKNKAGNFLNKKRSLFPSYFVESWRELKKVTWPGRRETTSLTLAVFAFAIVFGLLDAITDHGLDIVFKKLILK